MSKDDLLNWSTVLRRISWWLQTGNLLLPEKFIERGQKLYPNRWNSCQQRMGMVDERNTTRRQDQSL
jgi:hypothetical protein